MEKYLGYCRPPATLILSHSRHHTQRKTPVFRSLCGPGPKLAAAGAQNPADCLEIRRQAVAAAGGLLQPFFHRFSRSLGSTVRIVTTNPIVNMVVTKAIKLKNQQRAFWKRSTRREHHASRQSGLRQYPHPRSKPTCASVTSAHCWQAWHCFSAPQSSPRNRGLATAPWCRQF